MFARVISRFARRALVLVITATVVGLAPVQAGAAEPVGWQPVFSEAFDPPSTGCTASTGPAADSYDLPDEVTVSDGYLRLHLRRRTYQSFTFTSGSVRCAAAPAQYGRYEFRARAAGGPGVASYIALRGAAPSSSSPPSSSASSSDSSSSSSDDSRLDLVTTATGVHAALHNGYGTGTSERAGDIGGTDFHTYIVEWAPSGFRVYVDGTQRLVDAHVSTAQRTVGFGVTPANGLSAATVLPAEFAVDYLRVWTYDPSASPAPVVSSSTVEVAGSASVPPASDRHLFGWLIGTAVTALLVAGLALGVWHTRPRRPRPGHRA